MLRCLEATAAAGGSEGGGGGGGMAVAATAAPAEVPAEFVCVITCEVMSDPVATAG